MPKNTSVAGQKYWLPYSGISFSGDLDSCMPEDPGSATETPLDITTVLPSLPGARSPRGDICQSVIQMPDTIIMTVLFGLFFIVLGISIPPICGNATILFIALFLTSRIRPTVQSAEELAGDENWKKICERAGRVYIGAGILVLLAAIATGDWALDVMLVILLGATVYIGIISLWFVMQNTKENFE